MFRKIFLVLVLFQMSFAMDPSIVKVLGCLEKKRMSVISVEKIDGKIYVKKELLLLTLECLSLNTNKTACFRKGII